MVKIIHKIARLLLAVAYVIIGYYNLTAMVGLITQARDVSDMVCAIAVDIVWATLLFFGGVLIYYVTFSKSKSIWD